MNKLDEATVVNIEERGSGRKAFFVHTSTFSKTNSPGNSRAIDLIGLNLNSKKENSLLCQKTILYFKPKDASKSLE
jgi:hypothetical protein